MKNRYLKIESTDGEITLTAVDMALTSIATFKDKGGMESYCDGRAEEWVSSSLMNYTRFDKATRSLMAEKWVSVKSLPDGEYNFYFNKEERETVLEKAFEDEYAKISNGTDLRYSFPLSLADCRDLARHFFDLGADAVTYKF